MPWPAVIRAARFPLHVAKDASGHEVFSVIRVTNRWYKTFTTSFLHSLIYYYEIFRLVSNSFYYGRFILCFIVGMFHWQSTNGNLVG